MGYDAAGNLTNDTYSGQGQRTFDAENRMKQAWANGQWQTYTYDGDGKRIKRSVNGAETWQVYGLGGELLAEYAANTAPTLPQKEYGYRNGQLLVTATAPVGTGTGLQAQYYDNVNFTNLKVTRTDASIDFDWGGGAPDGSLGVDTFTTRWTGKVEPQYSETYTFYTQTDDGVRLWVNGQLLIDKWIDQGSTEWSGQLTLTAGQRFDIRMDFYENGGGAMAKLSWSSANQPKQIVPQSRLYLPGSTAQVSFNWLVADQLGTPRIIFDQTGSLASTSRHDYFPFGEEMFVAGRTPQLGYTGSDGTRQKFTLYERDGESGLDFAQGRYYNSTAGRFISADPVLSSSSVWDPQSWNKYAYVRNNPMSRVDPSGLWDWGASLGGLASDAELMANVCAGDACTEEERKAGKRTAKEAQLIVEQRKKFIAAIDFMKTLLNSTALTAGERDRIQSILKGYGTKEDHNGVFMESRSGSDPETIMGAGMSIVFLDFSQAGVGFNIAAVHEGQHVADYMDFYFRGGPDLTKFDFEVRGFEAEGIAAKGRGMPQWETKAGTPQNELVWNKQSWGSWSAADIATARTKGAVNRVWNTPSYGVNPQNKGPRLSNLPRMPFL